VHGLNDVPLQPLLTLRTVSFRAILPLSFFLCRTLTAIRSAHANVSSFSDDYKVGQDYCGAYFMARSATLYWCMRCAVTHKVY
jgi:hypothetical protein